MFEAVGVTVSRLIRTRFGDIVLPRNLRRGRWEELDGSLVTALMVQLGLLRDGDESEGRRKSRQPQSHDSALPPGFGTLERNGMNGARIGRRGKLQGGRPGSAAACPSDPFGTGLMITGGYANGHPLGNDSAAGRGGKGKPAKGKAGGDKPQRGQGRKAAGAQAGGQARRPSRRARVAARRRAARGGAWRQGCGWPRRRQQGSQRGRQGGRRGQAGLAHGQSRSGRTQAATRASRRRRCRRWWRWWRWWRWPGRRLAAQGAGAHESRLGFMGGRGGRGR